MTTLSTQPCANATRAAPAGPRVCARRKLRLQRRPLRAAVTAGGISRAIRIARARIVLQRVRPSPTLRGFLPLYRH
ncbi:MAG: hypothetical protein ABI440_01805 [Casimicrobiaceae bacterium]